MTARVEAGLRVVQVVAGRPDPTEEMLTGAIGRAAGMPLSSASRLCAELVDLGLLARGEAYGSYRVGPAALRLSGVASEPSVAAARSALTRLAHGTGETAVLAVGALGGVRIVDAVPSPWTLHSPARAGELVADQRSASVQALARVGVGMGGQVTESRIGKCVELAVPVLEPGGECVGVLAVRLPVNRAKEGVPVARRALAAERRTLERTLDAPRARPTPPGARGGPSSALAATLVLLEALGPAEATVSELCAATGIRRDRALRLLESCHRVGFVRFDADGERMRLTWMLHGWLRAAVRPTLVAEGAPLVAAAADATGVCAFITVLRGMRSVTLVEEIRSLGAGLDMTPWLGRPCPIPSADGGPTLVMDFDPDDIPAFLPRRTDARELADFRRRVAVLVRDGVLATESFEEAGQTAVTAPIRDASGAVAAAVCLVGTTDDMRPRIPALKAVALELSADLSGLVGYRSAAAAGAAA
ncbi:hypothetical protein [Microbacterium arborescens]|uniref:hypothetical protein n=1 Tax=Microbacterium arborescens TaxID=33883 RepID=UPI003C744A00